MSKFMIRVEKDIMAEITGNPSMAGQSVEVVKKIPAFSAILVSAPGMGTPSYYPVSKDVYLVNAPKTRWMFGKKQCEVAMVMSKGYVGNDIYSAEELGL